MLLDAVNRGRLYQVKYLLDTDTHDVNKTDENKQTALVKTVFLNDNMRSTRQKIARILLAHGALVNKVDREGRTALIWACIMGRQGIVKTLLEKAMIDLDINASDHAGNTALFYAASEGHADIVKLLVKAMQRFGLDIDKKNARGMTPMLEAAKRGHDSCVKVLIAEGQASLTVRDPQMFLNTREWAQRRRSLLSTSDLTALRSPSPLTVQNVDDDDVDAENSAPKDGGSSPRDGSNGARTVLGSRLRSNSRNSQTVTNDNAGGKISKSPSLEVLHSPGNDLQKLARHRSTTELHSEQNVEASKANQTGSNVSLKRRKPQKQPRPVTAKSEMCRLLGLYGIQHSETFRQGFDPISLPPSGYWPDPLAHLRDNLSTVSSDDLESVSDIRRRSLSRRRSSATPGMQEGSSSARRGSNIGFLRESRRTSLMPGSSLPNGFGRRTSNIPASTAPGLKAGFLQVPGRRTSLMPPGERNHRPQVVRRVTAMPNMTL